MTLTEDEDRAVKGINEDLSRWKKLQKYIYLSRLLNFYIGSNLRRPGCHGTVSGH